ncbi:hypothetical protein C7H19_03125 [Aphanothece hegewaldii CCALA 016]|uniref:Sll0756 protein n=1 Tax=Aphanothece hegewaldii CCALA 016 TaxID=2107694 RepID=A0A2T1M2T3_9CHRO|nr:hypothetical protein [Aphanothece hegewaldii]PSF39059.1 hypothetical protein C7H19_03125 [Aphanothece hegewaldii CCALA 016]
MFSRTIILGILASLLGLNLPVRAETCTPLTLVGGRGSEITKTVAQPTIPGPFGIKITRNNWNTDWAVPGGILFNRYVATMTSADGGTFDIILYLKYSDQTEDEFFNSRRLELAAGKPLIIEATPRPEEQPFHVNLFVNGVASIGETYTASVVACR